jgi:hypothetical protein
MTPRSESAGRTRRRCDITSTSFLVSIAALRGAGGWNSAYGDHETELVDLALRSKSTEGSLAIGVESSAIFAHEGEGEGESEGSAAAIVAGTREARRRSAMQALGEARGLRSLVARDGQTTNLGCTAKTRRCAIDYAVRTRTLPPCCKEKLKAMLHAVSGMLTAHKIAHWIDFSTLLGAVRHEGNIVPWDVDVDLSLMKVRRSSVRSVASHLFVLTVTPRAPCLAHSLAPSPRAHLQSHPPTPLSFFPPLPTTRTPPTRLLSSISVSSILFFCFLDIFCLFRATSRSSII